MHEGEMLCAPQSKILENILQHLGEANRAVQIVEECHIESPVKPLIL